MKQFKDVLRLKLRPIASPVSTEKKAAFAVQGDDV
jgi:hypothetical protein